MAYGIVGTLIFVLDVVAIISVLGSAMDVAAKLFWTLIILLLPVIGMILWFVIGRANAMPGR